MDRGAPERRGDRHPRVLLRGARDPRRCRRPERAAAAQHRGVAAVRPAVGGRAAPGLPPGRRAPDHPRHQRGRDLADRARHRLRGRHRYGPHLALQPAHQGAAPADRAGQPGQRLPARRSMRPRRTWRVHPPLLGGGLRGAPRVHRARDPTHLARLGHPPDDLVGPGRRQPFPVRRPARRAPGRRRRPPPGGARRLRDRRPGPRPAPWPRTAPHGIRDHPGAAAARPAARPDGDRGRAARLHPGGAHRRRGPVHPGPARAPGGQGGAGRPVARPLQGRPLRLRHPPQALALPQGPAERAVAQRLSTHVQGRVPPLPAHP